MIIKKRDKIRITYGAILSAILTILSNVDVGSSVSVLLHSFSRVSIGHRPLKNRQYFFRPFWRIKVDFGDLYVWAFPPSEKVAKLVTLIEKIRNIILTFQGHRQAQVHKFQDKYQHDILCTSEKYRELVFWKGLFRFGSLYRWLTFLGTCQVIGTIEEPQSCRTRLTSAFITSIARFGTKHAPLVCSPEYLRPSTKKGSLSESSINCKLRSPLPDRKHMCVSGSYKGTKILNGKIHKKKCKYTVVEIS